MIYQYTALRNTEKVKGELEAGSPKEVAESLKLNKLFPIDIREKKAQKIGALLDKVKKDLE